MQATEITKKRLCRSRLPDAAVGRMDVRPGVDAHRLAALGQLQFHVLVGLAVDDEYVYHVVRQQLARIADVDCRFCT